MTELERSVRKLMLSVMVDLQKKEATREATDLYDKMDVFVHKSRWTENETLYAQDILQKAIILSKK